MLRSEREKKLCLLYQLYLILHKNILVKSLNNCVNLIQFHIVHDFVRKRGGVVVERRTPNREILCSIPTSVTVLGP